MAFTGEVIHGWRVADRTRRRRASWPPRWVEEPVYELVKGQRHVRARGEDGIDPALVLARAVTAALEDDIREARSADDPAAVLRLTIERDRHEAARRVRENGHAAGRSLGRVRFGVGAAGAGATGA